jgi:hypothetical protein
VINISPSLYFTLDGVLSHTPGWRAINTLDLAKPAHTRGGTPRVIPHAAGARPMPLRRDATERIISLHVYGRRNGDGGVNSSEIDGLQTNLGYLAAAWAAVPATSGSTRTLVLYRLGTSTTGPVQVLDMDWDWAEMPVAATMVLRLLLPEGALQ